MAINKNKRFIKKILREGLISFQQAKKEAVKGDIVLVNDSIDDDLVTRNNKDGLIINNNMNVKTNYND